MKVFSKIFMLLLFVNNLSCLHAQTYEYSLKILTYNTKATPINTGCKPDKISDKINASGADIVVLTEVFDNDDRNDFLSHLSAKGIYKHFILEIDASDWPHEQCMGLFVASKFPFEFYSPDYHDGNASISLYNKGTLDWGFLFGGLKTCTVSYVEFNDEEADDKFFSDKGCALIKVYVPKTQYSYREVWLAFTHLQADYPEDGDYYMPIRQSQLKQIKNMIDYCTDGKKDGQIPYNVEVYLVGDLNINGNMSNKDPNQLVDDPVYNYSRQEWEYHFSTNVSTRFFTWELHDTYHETNSGDAMQTSGNGLNFPSKDVGERLDYICWNKPKPDDKTACIQHLHRYHNLDPYSDHCAIMADINVRQTSPLYDHNTPVYAKEIGGPYGQLGYDGLYNMYIQYTGGMHWYKITRAGSYNIKLTGINGKVKLDIYHNSDLGLPLNLATGVTHNEYGPQYSMPDPPYFLRVSLQNRFTSKINYQIRVHKNLGVSRDDAIYLEAGAPLDYQITPAFQPNPENQIYYSFHNFRTDNRKPSEARCVVRHIKGPAGYEIKLYDGHTFLESCRALNEKDPIHLGTYPYHRIVRTNKACNNKLYYMAVIPPQIVYQNYPNNQGEYGVRFETTYTRMVPYKLQCVTDTETDPADDEVFYLMLGDPKCELDGSMKYGVKDEKGWKKGYGILSDFDGGSNGDTAFLFDSSKNEYIAPIEFTSHIRVQFMDYDSGFNGDNDYFKWYIWYPHPELQRGLVIPFGMTKHVQGWGFPEIDGSGYYAYYWLYTHHKYKTYIKLK